MSTCITRPETAGHVARRRADTAPELAVGVAASPAEVRESQRLRYTIFAGEMGAQLATPEPGLDIDPYDDCCQHIIVRDRLTREVVASTRVLLDGGARLAGGFYSETEFDLGNFLRGAGRIMEIGRTCVHADYRSGAAISMLWSGLARFMSIHRFRYLIGCASIPMGADGSDPQAVYESLRHKYLVPQGQRVIPKLPLPALPDADGSRKATLPPLLKAYIRLGARIGGAPAWDPAFDCADLFIVLSPEQLQKRYANHFLQRRDDRRDS